MKSSLQKVQVFHYETPSTWKKIFPNFPYLDTCKNTPLSAAEDVRHYYTGQFPIQFSQNPLPPLLQRKLNLIQKGPDGSLRFR